MVRRILLSSAAVTVVGLTLATGIASAKPTKTTIDTNINTTLNVNNVGVVNANNQFAVSGSALALGGLKGGNAITGPATNINNTTTVVVVANVTKN